MSSLRAKSALLCRVFFFSHLVRGGFIFATPSFEDTTGN
jgi:hypothetical protein